MASPLPNGQASDGRRPGQWLREQLRGHVSVSQAGMLKQVTKINLRRACPNCGFVELHRDAEELKNRLG